MAEPTIITYDKMKSSFLIDRKIFKDGCYKNMGNPCFMLLGDFYCLFCLQDRIHSFTCVISVIFQLIQGEINNTLR
jgi:hypothetical protein